MKAKMFSLLAVTLAVVHFTTTATAQQTIKKRS
jgi:hypothetical protein